MKLFCKRKLSSLKLVFFSKPPFILVITSVISFSLVIMAACIYISKNPIRVENVMKDWNLFLEKLSTLNFCIDNDLLPSATSHQTTQTSLKNTTLNSNLLTSSNTLQASSLTLLSTPSLLKSNTTKRVTVQLQMTIQHPWQIKDIPYNTTTFHAVVAPAELGISSASRHNLFLSTTFLYSWHHSKCDSSSLLNINCDITTIQACISLEGDPSLFPESIVEPSVCTSMINHSDAQYTVQMEAYKMHGGNIKRCHGNLKLQLKHRPDPTLNVYLSMEVKSMIMKRLIKSSVVMVTLMMALLTLVLLRLDKSKHEAAHEMQVLQSLTGRK